MNIDALLEYYPVIFQDMVEYDGYMWFAACNFNGLFRMNVENGEIDYLGKFPTEGEAYLYYYTICYKGKLFFLPGCSGNVIEYDIEKETYISYKVPYCHDVNMYYGAGQYQQFVFFWSYKNFDIIRFDMESKEFKIINFYGENERDEDELAVGEFGVLWRGYCVVENHLYVPSLEKSVILDICMQESAVKLHNIQGLNGYLTVCYDGEKFWLTGLENRLVVWRPDIESTEIYEVDPNIPVKDIRMGIYINSKIYYVLNESSAILVLHTDSMEFNYIGEYEKQYHYWNSQIYSFKTVMLKNLNKKIWAVNCIDATLQTIENEKRVFHSKKLVNGIENFVKDRVKYYFSTNRKKESCLGEGLNINEFIQYVGSIGEKKNDTEMRCLEIGKRINNEIDKQVIGQE